MILNICMPNGLDWKDIGSLRYAILFYKLVSAQMMFVRKCLRNADI
jgi:hypothetical protein